MSNKFSRIYGLNVFKQPVDETIKTASAKGMKHIELNLGGKKQLNKTLDITQIRHLKKIAKKNKISLSIHLPNSINIADIIAPIRKSNIAFMIKVIEAASELEATHLTCHVGSYFWFPHNATMRKSALKRFVKNISDIIKICDEHKTVIALENVSAIPHGSEYYFLGDNIDDFEYIFSEVNSDYLKFCLDIGHANLNEGAIAYMNAFKSKLACIHYHDNLGENDNHLPIGKGNVDWNKIADTIENIGYTGPLVSECRRMSPSEAASIFESYFSNVKNQYGVK